MPAMPADIVTVEEDISKVKNMSDDVARKIAETEEEIKRAVGDEKQRLQDEKSKLQDKENILLNAALQKENLLLQHRLEMERLGLGQQAGTKHLRLHVQDAITLLSYLSSSSKVDLGGLPLLPLPLNELMPTATSNLSDHIIRLHADLSQLPSLSPAPRVDALFEDLVRTCIGADERASHPVLADTRVASLLPDLQRICSEGESLLEEAWAQRVLAAGDPWAELARFPYLENYEQLSRLELHTLAGAGHRKRHGPLSTGGRICFLGGGPLPLSALIMHRELSSAVDVVDNQPRAVDLAQRVLARLVPPGEPGLRNLLGDASSPVDMARLLAGCDVVIVAALVGRTQEQKRAVLRAVGSALDPGAYLVVRTAHGLRSLLYPVVDLADVAEAAGCALHVLVHPLGDVVNSVLVARRLSNS